MNARADAMDLTLRLAARDDVDAVAVMLDALDRHYIGDAAPGLLATRQMVDQTLRAQEGTRFLLAFDDVMPVAIACFAILRPGRKLSGLIYVKDLFVVESQRGAGVGAAMMRWLALFATENGIGRIELTTDRANAGAIRFYESLGGARPEKIHFRFEADALARLAQPS